MKQSRPDKEEVVVAADLYIIIEVVVFVALPSITIK